MQKWGGRPHWEFDALHLGDDEHGEWLGVRAGTRFTRPGADYVSTTDQVCLFPSDAYVATFHAPGGPVSAYVDIATPPLWHPRQDGTRRMLAVDLDLDVVRGNTGRVWIDDEDEFAEHRVTLDYPDEIVALAQDSCSRVHAAVGAGTPPFDAATPLPWFGRLRGVDGSSR